MSFLIGAEIRFKVQKDTQNSRIVLDSFNFRENEMSRLGITTSFENLLHLCANHISGCS